MLTRSWTRKLFARTPRTIHRAPPRCRPAPEVLEDRTTPSTLIVTSTAEGDFS